MNVAAYIRVSTDGQVGEDKFGLDAQVAQIEEYCKKNDMTIIKWFKDEGESGAKERPGFDEIVYGDVANPPFEAVVVAKTDRVARDINVYYYYKMMLLKKDIKLVSVAEDFGQMGVFAGFLEAFTLCVAQMERENITKRTSAGRAVKASKGGYSGGRPPYGYEVRNGKYVINDKEAEIVRFVFEKRAMGLTLKAIADMLNKMGDATRVENSEFTPTTVNRILLRERLYRGEYKYGDGEWVKGEHEPILKD